MNCPKLNPNHSPLFLCLFFLFFPNQTSGEGRINPIASPSLQVVATKSAYKISNFHRKRFPDAVLIPEFKKLRELAKSLSEPQFPPKLRDQKIVFKSVIYEVVLSETGELLSMYPVTGDPRLIPYCKQALQKSNFNPFIYNGRNVQAIGLIEFRYDPAVTFPSARKSNSVTP